MTRSAIWGVMFGALVAGSGALASEGRFCRPIHARIHTEFTTENCTSPLGQCTAGEITGDRLLAGTTFYTVKAAGPTPVDPTAQSSMAFAGTMVITTANGTLTIDDLGLLDRANGIVSEQSRSMAGTGLLAGATGQVFFWGESTATGFSAHVSGRICLAQ